MMLNNLCFVASILLLLVTTRGAGDNTAQNTIWRCRENERRALLDFKAGVFDEYGMLSSWRNNNNNDEDCCNWRGISCSNRTGHVTALNIPGQYRSVLGIDIWYDRWQGLRGKVSPLIELKHLRYLNLGYNQFDGRISHQLRNLTNLRSLELQYNDGLIIENLDWLSNLHMLTNLDLSNINLNRSNDWLQQIYKLSSLTELRLLNCQLPDSPLLHLNNTTTSLKSLSLVDLSFNNLFSPSSYNWLYNFTSTLVQISLFNNFLGGLIPETFGYMASLEDLNIAKCHLEGELPRSFRNLSRLRTLYLDDNNFNGPLIDFLHPLATNEKNSLEVLSLGENKFIGSLPDFTRFPLLQELSIQYNQISGSFPKTFAQVLALVHLDLSGNQITGSFPNLTLFSSLEKLILRGNKLEGEIPEAYASNLPKLKHLDLSSSALSLNFSFDWAPPFQLDFILLENCTLGPHFPNWIKSQRTFSVIDISRAGISDSIPLWFWDQLPPNVSYLDMSDNNIQGILPDLSLKFHGASYVWLDMSSNHLSGPVPSLPINMVVLDLSYNMLSGSLSFLCTTPNMILSNLLLSNNQLSDMLPDCLMNYGRLKTLALENNNLSGMIPESIGFLDRLQALKLNNNSFSGELASSLMYCKDLILLDLSENQLSGNFPTWIGKKLTSLKVFSLRKNNFSGCLPLEICHLREARVLDFSQNNLTGTIPNCINNLTSFVEREVGATPLLSFPSFYSNITYLVPAVVQWKGVSSIYSRTLGLLKLIDLSSNMLDGEIPEEFACLKDLISLNLSTNNLTGNIFSKIGQMKSLEILDLSNNQLSGKIPTNLAKLTLLNNLDLSNNHFTGPIPSSTQLQSLDASKYAGNEELCGRPLTNMCGDEHSPTIPHEENDNGNDKSEKIGLYVSVILGVGTGFWGFLGLIMFKRTRRRVYYRFLGMIADWVYVTTTLSMARLKNKFYG